MRPVNKGKAPEKVYKDYRDAEPDLEERIGAYCSFCEMPIKHVPEVEHKEAKAKGGAKLEWENLLLSCKYCNTRKGTQVGKGDKGKYLWPDEDDTFHAYRYDRDLPRLNESFLKKQGERMRKKADNTYQLFKLNNMPITPKDKDRRYMLRNEARNYATQSKRGLEKVRTPLERTMYINAMKNLALESGFFSVWMEVFHEDEEIKQILIETFKGTKEEYCKDYE